MSARTQNKRLWLGGGAVLGVLIVLIGWFGVIDPQLSDASATRGQADTTRMQNATLQAKNAKLKAQNDDVAALRAGLAEALAELPSDGGLAEFTRQISAQATATSVVLTSVAVATPTPVADPTTATGTGTSDPGANTAETTTTAGSASTPTDSLLQIGITVTATGLGADLQAFLSELQLTGPRRALVDSSRLAPKGDSTENTGNAGNTDGPCTLNLALTIFSGPLSTDAQAGLEKLLSGN